jgi:hypothetical protein
MTSWKTCFKAYKISKIQELPGALPIGLPPGLRPGPTGGIRAAPIPPSQIVLRPLLLQFLDSPCSGLSEEINTFGMSFSKYTGASYPYGSQSHIHI